MNKLLVSIIIPYYNSEKFVERLIISIKNQIYSNFECILVDDGSTDNSFDLVNKLIEGDERFLNQKRPLGYKYGGRGSKNYGFTISRGDYIVFFDADDEMESCFLSLRADFLSLRPDFEAVISNYNYRYSMDSDKINTLIYNNSLFVDFRKIVGKEDFWLHYLSYKFYYNPGNAMYRRDIIMRSGMWNENTSIGEDYEFQSRLILKGMNLGHINAVTFNYMLNDFSMIATSDTIKPLLSRSFGRMLVLNNLVNHFGPLNAFLTLEFNWQIKILRRVVFCSDKWEYKNNVIYLLKLRANYILDLIGTSKIKKIKLICYLSIAIRISKICSMGYRLFDLLMLKEKYVCNYYKYMAFLKFNRL